MANTDSLELIPPPNGQCAMPLNGHANGHGLTGTGLHRRLRVCHLGKFYPPATGGIETHVRTLARAQSELGADVRVICVNHLDRHARNVMWQRYAVTADADEWDGPVRITRVKRYGTLARLDLCPGLARLFADLKPGAIDLLHLHAPNPTMLLALAGFNPRLPLVITHHSDVIRQRMLKLAIRPLEHLVFRRAARVLCCSPTYPAGSPLLQEYGDKLNVLPMGIDLEPFLHPDEAARAHTRRLHDEHGDLLWLTVGRIVYYKGLDVALRALGMVPGKLIVIGEGPLERTLQRLAREIGVADRVVWRGGVSTAELIGAYHAATALWFPSNARSEGFGLVQVEAMASGCPVINTAILASGVPWVSRHEETGLTVPISDPEALAGAANRLRTEPGLRRRLAEAGRARARHEFDHRTMARRSMAIYQSVLHAQTPTVRA
jgi:rhamnosyl/mannosyltransferase